jgi:hypothetical protein
MNNTPEKKKASKTHHTPSLHQVVFFFLSLHQDDSLDTLESFLFLAQEQVASLVMMSVCSLVEPAVGCSCRAVEPRWATIVHFFIFPSAQGDAMTVHRRSMHCNT